MEITLNVLRCPDHAVPESRRSSGADLSIGRDAARADWALPDRDMVVSKRHCVLEFRAGGWQVRDLSTNGTFRNHDEAPIGPDVAQPLFDGDRLRVGGWEIEVRITASPAAAGDGAGWGGMADPFADLAASPAAPRAAPSSGGFGAAPLIPVAPGRDHLHDPLAPPPPPRPAFNQPLLPDDFDPFADDAVAGAAMPDHAPAALDAFTPPVARPDPAMFPSAGGGASAIPDDWDLLGPPPPPVAPPIAPPEPAPAEAPQRTAAAEPVATDPFAADPFAAPVPIPPPPAPPPPAPAATAGADDPFAALDIAPLPAAAAAPAPASMPPRTVGGEAPADPFAEGDFRFTPTAPAPISPVAVPPAAVAPIAPAPVAPPATPTAAAPVAAASDPTAGPGAGDGAALAAFLEGAGLPTGALPPGADAEAVLRAAGAGFRAAVAGLRALLIARADVKREFRIEQTMLRASNNNPVKFAPTDEAAVLALIGARDRASLGRALDGLAETVADLSAHQVATLAATQAAARALLDRLAPAGLEAADPGGGLLPGARERRLWDGYRTLHRQVTEQFEDDFDSAFGKAFARAYEAATKRGEG